MSNQKQVIVLRKDLNMRKGKMVAQGAHASLKAILDIADVDGESEYLCIPLLPNIEQWLTSNFKKITVSVNSELELLTVYNKAKEAGLLCSLIQDSGLTEFGGVPTYTAVAIGPDEDDRVNQITGNLPLL